MDTPRHGQLGSTEALDGEPYDDSQDHDPCPDCKGSGYYVGFLERSFCRTCDGSGWV